jgi:hypothetical protein
VEFFNALVISVFGTDLTLLHQVITVNRKRILEAIKVPVLEQSQIEAHMGTCEPFITTNKRKESIEVPYIIHTAFRFLVIEMEC